MAVFVRPSGVMVAAVIATEGRPFSFRQAAVVFSVSRLSDIN